jgi:hypothetical protein
MIIVILLAGWGPLFVVDYIRVTRPDLDAAYVPQAIAMQWLPITVLCSVIAGALILVHGFIFLFRRLGIALRAESDVDECQMRVVVERASDTSGLRLKVET